MPEIVEGVGVDSIPVNEGDIPVFEYPTFDQKDTAYTDPTSSLWSDPKESVENNNPIIIAKVLRSNKREGTMKVIGIHDDIYADVPVPTSMISTEHMGDVSQPASEAQVILAKMPNGDYLPLSYIRPYSDEKGYGTGVPNELEEGDLGWETRGGGKLYMFENGMIQVEAAPNCNRFYYPLDDGEKIQDMCREYNMVTDAGTVQLERRGIVDFTHLLMEAPELAASNPAPIAILEMGALNDANTETGILMKVYQSNVAGVTVDAAHLKLQKTGISELKSSTSMNIEAPRTTLGGSDAIEPVPLGLKLQAEIEAIKTYIAAHIHTTPVGTATIPSTPPTIPLTTPGGYLSGQNFVK